ncbi:MAG: hypothetical protein H0W51_03125, partial [Euzebyales bacterium]|nr:hypothetical protein [Euzebyales bacterium]
NGRIWEATGPGQVQGLRDIYGDPQNMGTVDTVMRQGRLHGQVVDLFGGPGGVERFIAENPDQVANAGAEAREAAEREARGESAAADAAERAERRRARQETRADARRGRAAILETLGRYFDDDALKELSALIEEWITQGLNEAQIMQELRQTEAYQERFSGMEMRRQNSPGAAPLTEAQYVQMEGEYATLMQEAGLQRGFYDEHSDFAEFIGGNVSPAELSRRLTQGFVEARSAPIEVRRELDRLFGAGASEVLLTEFFLDPDRSWDLIQREFNAAQISGMGTITGFGRLNERQALRLADLGITPGQAQQGFSNLGQSAQLMTSLPGERGLNIGRDEQLDAVFGQNAKAIERIRKQREGRIARFEGGGGAAANNEGIVGAGSGNL